jgi:RimJ/RimL family protein N-acetyltransferase
VAKLPDVLRSGDLTLRRWDTAFVEGLLSAIEDSYPELADWMPWAQSVPSKERLLAVLAEGDSDFDADRCWEYVLFDSLDTVVGAAGIRTELGRPAIGYWVRSGYTGRGYATVATQTLVDAAFEFLDGIDQVVVRMDVANGASAAIPPKLGFRLEGEEDREIAAQAHTGRGYVWVIDRPEQ